MSDLEKAKSLLIDNNTCVLVKDNSVFVSQKRGIAPILDYMDEGIELRGYSVADRIVGKAAAMLFAKSGIVEVYAQVLSEKGKAFLEAHNISVTWQKLVSMIINRHNTGMCPMEATVADIEDLEEAHLALKEKRRLLMAKAKS